MQVSLDKCENEALIVVHVRAKLEPRVTFTFHSIASDSISIPFFLFLSVALANSLFSYPFFRAIFEEYNYRSRNEQCINLNAQMNVDDSNM